MLDTLLGPDQLVILLIMLAALCIFAMILHIVVIFYQARQLLAEHKGNKTSGEHFVNEIHARRKSQLTACRRFEVWTLYDRNARQELTVARRYLLDACHLRHWLLRRLGLLPEIVQHVWNLTRTLYRVKEQSICEWSSHGALHGEVARNGAMHWEKGCGRAHDEPCRLAKEQPLLPWLLRTK